MEPRRLLTSAGSGKQDTSRPLRHAVPWIRTAGAGREGERNTGAVTDFATASALLTPELHGAALHAAAVVPEDWTQGRTAFGGLGAAILLRAVQALPDLAHAPVRSCDTAFIGPLPPGKADVRAEVLRSGKHLTHVRAELRSAGQAEVAATMHVVLGEHRDSGLARHPEPPDRPGVDDCLALPFIEGIMPRFLRNMELRFAGALPYSGDAEGRISGYCRHAEPVTGVAGLVALVDAWPPAVITMVHGPAPASTVRWGLQLPYDVPFDHHGWYWYDARTVITDGGHATTSAQLWDGDRLVAWSEQLVAIFDRRS